MHVLLKSIPKKVIVGISGGVDSAVAAFLLKEQGYNVFGLHIVTDNNFDESEIKKIASILDISYTVIDKRGLFQEKVKEYFFTAYESGLTPNPCVICNRFVKFKVLYDFMINQKADNISTGHYACIENGILKRARDRFKDQSYFLSNVQKEHIRRLLLPLGDLLKTETKQIAKRFSLELSQKKESQDICFIKGDYKNNFHQSNGAIKNLDGKVIGEHNGVHGFTIGQRKGVGVSHSVPLYVKEIDICKNEIVVAELHQLSVQNITIIDVNLLFPVEKLSASDGDFYLLNDVDVKIRAANNFYKCSVLMQKDLSFARLTFHRSVMGIAKGQFAVGYENDAVIFSGVIN